MRRTRHSMYLGDFGDDEAPGDSTAMGPASALDYNANLQPNPVADAAASGSDNARDVLSQPPQQTYYAQPQGGAGSTSSPPLVAQQQSTTAGGFLTGLTSGITSFFGPAKPTTPMAAPNAMPTWVLPVVLGVGGLAVVALVMSSRRPAMGRYKRRSRR